MRALRVEAGALRLIDLPEPIPGPNEAVIRVALAGICGTDLEIVSGYMGFTGTPGHEFVGVVERAPDPAWAGRRVAGEINASCGSCALCREGMRRHCPRRTVLGILGRDGAFAERLVLPMANLHEVPPEVPDDLAVLIEPLAAAHEVLEQVRIAPGMATAVIGDGRLGQLCARAVQRAGAEPLLIGRHPAKLVLAGAVGIRTTDRPDDLPREFAVVVEATGSPTGFELAMKLVRPRGTIVLKSTYHGAAAIALAPVVIDEITVVGSRCGPFAPAIAHLASDARAFTPLITACYSLERAEEAFARASMSDAMKVLLAP